MNRWPTTGRRGAVLALATLGLLCGGLSSSARALVWSSPRLIDPGQRLLGVSCPSRSLCVAVTLTHSTGGKPFMLYDGTAGVADTRIIPPTSVVPESVLPFAALALAIPLVTGRRRILTALRFWR